MISLGGPGLLLAAVLGLFLAERLWVRILCGVVLAVYAVVIGVGVATGEMPPAALSVPILLATLAIFVSIVVKSYGKY